MNCMTLHVELLKILREGLLHVRVTQAQVQASLGHATLTHQMLSPCHFKCATYMCAIYCMAP